MNSDQMIHEWSELPDKDEGEQTYYTKSTVPVYFYPNPHLHSFCLCLYLRAGSIFEDEETHGITHFFEHIVFKNINRLMDGNLYRELDKRGLAFNGCTYKEFVQFYITGAPRHFEAAVDILTRIFEPIVLNVAEIDTERRRVKSELRESDEMNSLEYFTEQLVWKDSTAVRNVLGTCASLDKIGLRALKKAQKALLSSNNIFFYVTGRFGKSQIEYLGGKIDAYKPKVTCPLRENRVTVPKDFFKRNIRIEAKSASFYYVRFSFDVDTTRYSEAENSLFYDMLFEGDSNRIHQELSDRTGYVYSFGNHYERYNNIGNICLYFEVRPADLYKALEVVVNVFNSFKEDVSDEDLAYVLPEYTDNAELLMDDAEGFNWNRAYECHILSESYRNVASRKDAYLEVTPERIRQMAREIFRPENLVFTYKAPKNKVDQDLIHNILSKL